ncbi:COG3747 Phage terminase, small subunit [uncultured Caudovirales phage]|uniref:COG3747 Phage terminase, small subunit n=1 Tax=uncultured Caudovirales phage TaxID=2100421 RepID=A0A6J5QLS5_9CAUD|nr:COG3747 Phage terminase, small subunit [uncultured Caudovirales phage]
MGARGPKPDPNSKRSQRGENTLHKKRARPKSTAAVHPPATVKKIPAAARWWRLQAPRLIEAGRLRPEQGESFGLLCRLKCEIDQLEMELMLGGWVLLSEKGAQPNPVVRILRDARRDFVALSREFGMTPAADSRIPQDDTHAAETDPEEVALRMFITKRA